MKKRFEGFIIFGIFFFSFFSILKVEAQSANDYIPEIKITGSTNGFDWSELIFVREFEMGQPFYLAVESSVRVPGFWLRNFGAKELLCTIAFPQDQLIDINIQDSETAVSSFSLEQTVEKSGVHSVGILDNDVVDVVVVIGTPALLLGGKLVVDKIRELRHNKKLNDFLQGNHNNTFRCFSYSIPTTPGAEQLRKVRMVFKIDPKQTGSQTIKIFFDYRVSDIYMKTYTLVVN